MKPELAFDTRAHKFAMLKCAHYIKANLLVALPIPLSLIFSYPDVIRPFGIEMRHWKINREKDQRVPNPR